MTDKQTDRQTIGVWGWFGYRNCGDDLLLLNLAENLQHISGGAAQIVVFGTEENIKDLLPQKTVSAAERTARSALKYAWKTDLFLVGPGGLFSSENTKKLLFYLVLTGMIKLRRKRIGYIGVGIGTGMFQKKRNIFLLNEIARMADVFISRSRNYQRFLSVRQRQNILLASDMAFSDKKLYGWERDGDPKLVAVALANIFSSNTKEYEERFQREICMFLEFILDKGYRIHLIPFTNEEDEHFHNEICRKIGSGRIKSIPCQKNPYETYGRIARAGLCVGMRFHALVMSMILGIPVMSISYSDKNEDLMERFGLSRYSVRFGVSKNEYYNKEIMIDAKELIDIFTDMEEKEMQIRGRIAEHIDKIRGQSEVNVKGLKKLLKTV
ncbi:MAG: hypothetical protein HFH49_02080 [Lachnospiraceae bacterium]|nr:hypothetical protein [Lachnospiraceae bacterium]